MGFYSGKRIFLTGGSSGIGKAAGVLLARAGANVVLAARGPERLKTALEEVRAAAAFPGQIFGSQVLDVADRAAVQRAASAVLEQLGGIDIVINNAGITHPGYITEVSSAIYDAMMATNYFGTVNVTQAFLPTLLAQRSGRVVCVSSMLGFMGLFGYAPYAASKFALVGYCECLRQDVLGANIKVSILYPPDTDTPQFEEENRIKPFETRTIAGSIKAMSAERVAAELLVGIEHGKLHIVPGFSAKFVRFVYRHAPWLVHFYMDSSLRSCQRKMARQAVTSGSQTSR